MLTITDYGCIEHQSCRTTFDGMQAMMVNNLIANLPINGGEYTYICQYGHTHRVLASGTMQAGFRRIPRGVYSDFGPSS